MPRLVIASFLILGWAFYELSGGADFVPRGVRPQPPAPKVATPAPEPEPTAPAIAPRQPRETADRAPPESAGKPTKESRRAALKARQAERAARLRQIRGSLGQGLALQSDNMELGALEQGAAGLRDAGPAPAAEPASPPVPAAEQPDIREVTGTRVNMRDGPGTIYPVTARLRLGQKVEVLSASGTGWLRLRTVQARRIGWVAAALVSKKAE